MTTKPVFDYQNYKHYLDARLSEKGARSGQRAALARQMEVQSSYLSQVLHGKPDLTLEQALRANDFFEHDSQEKYFFMLLVQKARATTKDLSTYFEEQLHALLKERSKIKSRLVANQEVTLEQQGQYYSSWDYVALHMALAVPELRTARALSQHFALPIDRTEKILNFLVGAGLATKDRSEYQIGKIHMHLSQDAPTIIQHHTNWRLESLRRIPQSKPEQLHYSGVYSLSRKDYDQLRENLMTVIKRNLEVVRPSPEEIVVAQCIDLIPL